MRGRSGSRLSPQECSVRIGLAVIAALIGWNAVTQSLALALRSRSPERAHALAPGNAQIAATLSAKWVLDPAQQAESVRLAHQALRRDATAVQAVVALGLEADQRGDKAASRRLFAYSQKLSRRNLIAQIWAIEDAVTREDIAGALRHYDIALRTTNEAPDILYPVLAAAIADPVIRAELTRTLAAKPAWGPFFIDYVARQGPDPRATAGLFQGLQRARIPVSESSRTALIGALAEKGDYESAWAYFASTRTGMDRRRSRDPRFVMTGDTPSQFDWQVGNGGGISVSIQPGGSSNGGIVDFVVPASIGGLLLRQLQLLPPGHYILTGRSAGVNQPDGARPYWTLVCLDGRELGRVVLPNSAQNRGRFGGSFTVLAGCPVQYLSLIARPSDALGGLSGQIEEAALRPSTGPFVTHIR